MAIKYERIINLEEEAQKRALIDFIKRFQFVNTTLAKTILAKAKAKYKALTGEPITENILEKSSEIPLKINGLIGKLTFEEMLNDTTINEIEVVKVEVTEETKKTKTPKKTLPKKTTKSKIPKTETEIETEPLPVLSTDIFVRQMVRVQGGKFRMGNKRGKSNEKPEHLVQLKTFYISQYEVTQKQWREIMGEDHKNYNKNCDNCPVDNISWKVANDFIQRLNEKTGKNYRLPTEAEWEYAARGGQISKNYKYAGDNNLKTVGWYSRNSRQTQPVGSKPPNELNLYDMSGNVYEWCSDWYDKDFYENSPTFNPQNTNVNNRYHVLRGGSWYNNAKYCRTTARRTNTDANENTSNGFRLVHD